MTRAIIAFPRASWERAHAHLFRDEHENFCFFLAGWGRTLDGWRFAVRDVIPVEAADVEHDPRSPRLVSLDFILRVFNRAQFERAVVLEAHTHPGSGDRVHFSYFDLDEMPGFAKYALDRLPGRPYVATVWGEASVAAKAFLPTGESIDIGEALLVGETLERVRAKPPRRATDARYARQAIAFGPQGQVAIRSGRVAVVGVGGLGAHVAQQLAYLGVREIVLVDPDVVELTNLNRLVGATPDDVGRPKVAVMERLIRAIAGSEDVRVDALVADVREEDALRAILSADVVFGCFDNDGPRLILNELARAYHLPYIDSATGIDAVGESVKQAGGRVVVVHPGGPCLNCMGELDMAETRDFLASTVERETSRRLGYVRDTPDPSVVTLNGVVASLATTEFLALVTGFRAARPYTTYYAMERTGATNVARREVKRDPDCYTCSLAGIGDDMDIKRFAPRERPSIAGG